MSVGIDVCPGAEFSIDDIGKNGGIHTDWSLREESWYRRGSEENGNRQFVVADPDGYLLRFYT